MLNRLSSTAARSLASIVATAAVVLAPYAHAQDSISLAEWSQRVWTSARGGDTAALDRWFSLAPEGFDDDRLAVLRDGITRFQANREAAILAREEARDTALEELHQHLEEGSLSQALRSAVEYQTLSEDFDAALRHEDVQRAIRTAEVEIPKAESERDWLYAQELLFRLRTLYDETSDRGRYNDFNHELKEANRRVMLLQQYAPEHLYELRSRLAERFGEDDLPPFNPSLVDDWRERLDGVNRTMLVGSLRHTASEHIEARGSEGWRPLLEGGLHALRTFATTRGLSEAFPGLADDAATGAWTRHIDQELKLLAGTPDDALQLRHLESVLNGLIELNERTLKLPEAVVIREFGDGAMFELSVAKGDDYSDIIWPDEVRRFRQQTEGSFVGVGILISYNDKREITVVSPLEGTPAFEAGIRTDDVIQAVDEVPTLGWSLNQAVDNITGKANTKVTLQIRRDGLDEPLDFTLERKSIKLPTIAGWYKEGLDDDGNALWDYMIDRVNKIGYVRITGFSDDTTRDLQDAWDAMRNAGARGLIVDLRYNPGGLLDQAVRVVNMFVRSGEVVSIEGRDAENREPLYAYPHRASIARDQVDVIVLVNKGSASASEIVSGALQAHGAAVVVGTRTWGKGSVQRVFGVAGRGSMAQLKLTTQYYRLPPGPGEEVGRLVHKRPGATEWGVDPDIVVEMTPHQIDEAIKLREAADRLSNVDGEEERPHPAELITRGLDPQLETALLLLQAKSAGEYGVEHARLN